MKLPRDLSGAELIKKPQLLGYEPTRQVGSHVRITTQQKGTHHVTVPAHKPLRVGTLSSILKDIANHFETSREEIISKLL